MTPKERAAMQQALEALVTKGEHHTRVYEAITVLRDVLAGTDNWTPPNYTDEQWQKLDQEYQDHVAEQEQVCIDWDTKTDEPIMGYAAPVRTKNLTDDEIREAVKQVRFDGMTDKTFQFARAVIAKDREKNK